jgi:hypothetical protein
MFKYEISTGQYGGEHCIGTISKEVGDYWASRSKEDFEGYLFSWNREEDYPDVPEKYQLPDWHEIDDIYHIDTVEFFESNWFDVFNTNTREYTKIDFRDVNRKELLIYDEHYKKAKSSSGYVLYMQSWVKGGFNFECNDIKTGLETDFVTKSRFDIDKVKNVRLDKYGKDLFLLDGFEYDDKYSFYVTDGDSIGKGYYATLCLNDVEVHDD